jgi:hypothetical protein
MVSPKATFVAVRLPHRLLLARVPVSGQPTEGGERSECRFARDIFGAVNVRRNACELVADGFDGVGTEGKALGPGAGIDRTPKSRVRNAPGSTTRPRIPNGSTSAANDSDRASNACFAAQ